MFGWFNEWRRRRRAYRRAIDINILWPAICAQASSRFKAEEAFWLHMVMSYEWQEVPFSEKMKLLSTLAYESHRDAR